MKLLKVYTFPICTFLACLCAYFVPVYMAGDYPISFTFLELDNFIAPFFFIITFLITLLLSISIHLKWSKKSSRRIMRTFYALFILTALSSSLGASGGIPSGLWLIGALYFIGYRVFIKNFDISYDDEASEAKNQ